MRSSNLKSLKFLPTHILRSVSERWEDDESNLSLFNIVILKDPGASLAQGSSTMSNVERLHCEGRGGIWLFSEVSSISSEIFPPTVIHYTHSWEIVEYFSVEVP